MTSQDSFEALPLAAPLQRILRERNYHTPSPVQAKAIPVLLECQDLLCAAQTGTGKTAAFALPILQQMHERPARPARNRPRALILTPTRELAVQVDESFRTYGRYLPKIHSALVHGGVSAGPQIRALRHGVDILVATPGRLLDLYRQGHIDFAAVEFFVLDEADRMLDMGFIPDIREIVKMLPEQRQSLFFSATLAPEITKLANEILTDAAEIRITPEKTTAENIDHQICFLQHEDKMSLLRNLLEDQQAKEGRNLTLVFSRTKHGADKLAKQLGRDGLRVQSIHGNKSQNARQRALDSFRKGRTPILIATDVAARGIDVKDVTIVINYDLPDEPEAYIHRIGRTARAGATGQALSFCTGGEMHKLGAIEKLLRAAIPVQSDHPFHNEKLANRRKPKGKPQAKQSGGRNQGKRKRFGQGKAPGKWRKNRKATAGRA